MPDKMIIPVVPGLRECDHILSVKSNRFTESVLLLVKLFQHGGKPHYAIRMELWDGAWHTLAGPAYTTSKRGAAALLVAEAQRRRGRNYYTLSEETRKWR